MRILHVTDAYLPRQGGIEMHVRDLARAQALSGDDVDILTCTRSDGAAASLELVDVTRPHPTAGPAAKTAYVIRHRRDGMRGNYDVVHAHGSTISPLSFLTMLTPGSPRLFTVHSLWRRYTPLYRTFDHLLRWSDLPVTYSAVSREAASDFRRAARHDLDVAILPNGINPDDWVTEERVSSPHHFRILAVMRLATRKRPMALLRVLRALRAAVPAEIAVSATILGDGPSRPNMAAYLARHDMTSWVALPGHVSRNEVKRAMARSDVFVAPASLESFGIAALEAHASGLPVVGRTGTGLSDFIEDGKSGNLVGSDRQMTEVLTRMAVYGDHTALSTSAGLEQFHWPAILQRHRDLYEVAASAVPGSSHVRSA